MKSDDLNSSEELTLRRVHEGISKASDLISHDVDRLVTIGLLARRGPDVALTDAGRQRTRNLPSADQHLTNLVDQLTKDGS